MNKKETKHLAELSRLGFSEKEVSMYEHDLAKILDYFNELKEVNTENVAPLTGGINLVNIVREDEPVFTDREINSESASAKSRGAFPDEEEGYLRVPAVFNE